ncbi:aminotransferase class I/II-fold pyridoxal phosphate-dependent enzyme [bacterium]|nr:aminotransferase class I/II-fold pyridoxal phosphate-dependent enzyme [bacterium]
MANMFKRFPQPIYVTRPFLPPIADYTKGLERVWASAHLTNHGPVLRQFEAALREYLRTENVALFANGTLALQIALRALDIKGDVITTPFTFAATTHALVWNGNRPVFADIEPDFYTLDPAAVEAAITPQTEAILAVHVFGFPCRLDELAAIAGRYKLRLIYDAAHAFGVTVDGQAIGAFGDVSMFSLHATKVFHAIEGGLLMFHDFRLRECLDLLKDFGIASETEVVLPGLNAKMNEFEALMGLLQLDHVPAIIEHRRRFDAIYREQLADVPGLRIPDLPSRNVQYNHAYFPLEIVAGEFGMSRDELVERLQEYNVFARRYFYPLVPDYACYRELETKDPLVVGRRVADRIVCLPIYDSLAPEDAGTIADLIRSFSRGSH